MMKRYVSKFKEQDKDSDKEERFDKKVDNIIKSLRDNDFGNEEARKHMLDLLKYFYQLHLLSSLHNNKDPRARKTFRYIGDLFTEIGDELIKYGRE